MLCAVFADSKHSPVYWRLQRDLRRGSTPFVRLLLRCNQRPSTVGVSMPVCLSLYCPLETAPAALGLSVCVWCLVQDRCRSDRASSRTKVDTNVSPRTLSASPTRTPPTFTFAVIIAARCVCLRRDFNLSRRHAAVGDVHVKVFIVMFKCLTFLVHGQVTIIFVVSVGLSVCLFVCAEFFSAVFDPISIKLGHM